jgi:regulator of RNase E activity RraA
LSRGAVCVPVALGEVTVSPGDLIIGDDDGLVALGPDAIRRGIEQAEAKIALEGDWIASLAAGRSARETFGLPEELT